MIVLDYRDKRPLNEQVAEKLMNLIAQGGLSPGDKLPSVRNMAVDLSINPNTVQRAYAALEEKGYIVSVTGRGNFVSEEESWRKNLRSEMISEFESVTRRVMTAGIGKEEALECVSRIYEE